MKMGSHEEDGVLAIVLFEEVGPKPTGWVDLRPDRPVMSGMLVLKTVHGATSIAIEARFGSERQYTPPRRAISLYRRKVGPSRNVTLGGRDAAPGYRDLPAFGFGGKELSEHRNINRHICGTVR